MTVTIEGPRALHVAGPAFLVDEDTEMAWDLGRSHIRVRRDFAWIMGRLLTTGEPNLNGHIFPLEDVRKTHSTMVHTALNMDHRDRYVVGTVVATELTEEVAQPSTASVELRPGAPALPPTSVPAAPLAASSVVSHPISGTTVTTTYNGGATAPAVAHPRVDALAAFWRKRFPEEHALVERAHKEGSLFYSMECVPETVTCRAEGGCGQTFRFAGVQDDTYCEHLNVHAARKSLNMPTFVGIGLVLPPNRPGWPGANVTELAGLIRRHQDEAAGIYAAVQAQAPHLEPAQWEQLMAALLEGAFGPVG